MSNDRAFLAVALAVFLATFAALLLFVRRRGHDPKGVTGRNKAAAATSTVATLLWLVVMLLYIFEPRSVAWFGCIPFLDNNFYEGLGIALSSVGVLVGIAGEVALGASFRIALPRERMSLVTSGIYRHIRNPCALGADLFALGAFLIAPSLLALLAAVLNLAGYHLKVRAEEAHLRRAHGAEYAAYCARTGRYLPRIRKVSAGG